MKIMKQQCYLTRLTEACEFTPKSTNAPSTWIGYIPFASWLSKEQSPKDIVKLGTQTGNSYFSMR
jgi:hypothetical protein